MTGHELIAQERKRQIEVEGYSENQDSENYGGLRSLQYAAEAYEYSDAEKWPWDEQYYKPTPNDPKRQLVKAGALYQAEADRLNAVISKGKFYARRQICLRYNDMISSVDRCAMKIDLQKPLAEQALKLKYR